MRITTSALNLHAHLTDVASGIVQNIHITKLKNTFLFVRIVAIIY